jgi:hypothetical protein
MPIKHLAADAAGGSLVQTCAGCGAEHTISLNRGGHKSKTGPFALRVGDTLVVRIDDAAPQTVTVPEAAWPNLAAVTSAQLVAHLRAQLPGARVSDDAGGVLIESATTGEHSRVAVIGGTACAALGFELHLGSEPACGRPVLGVHADAAFHDANVIVLRRCNDCGATECLVRTFDAAPRAHEGTHFHEHRRAVNARAQYARAQGWSHPALAARHASETHEPIDIDRSFPTRPLALASVQRAVNADKPVE